MKPKGIFVTATDTDAGKTITGFVLGVLLQEKGIDIGILKPVQCAGNDAQFLKKNLKIKDSLSEINPYFAKEPISPHLAFAGQKTSINIARIKKQFQALSEAHDFVIVEGAGGLMVPVKGKYLMADLAKDLNLDIIIVSKLSLGTINHTLLTIEQARSCGLGVKGVIFNQIKKDKRGIPERTNPRAIKNLSRIPILGTVPYLTKVTRSSVLKQCKNKINLNPLLKRKTSSISQRLKEEDKEYVWHPFTQMQDWQKENPLIINYAKGCYLKDTDGNWYLDGVSSLWVNLHGHQHKAIDEAIYRQIKKVSHSTLLGLSNTPAVELARELVKITPKALRKVFYSDSGSTAVEIAIKIAYQYWQNIGKKQKTKIVHLAHSYHGDTLGGVSVGGIDLFHKVYRHLIFKAVKWPTPYPDAFGNKKIFEKNFLKSVDNLELLFKKSHQTIAALVAEPIVQGAAGMIVWPKGILKRIEKLCQKYNVLLIADEVATGFGRTGRMFACEHENVTPDLMCLAKGISAGYLPLAATLTTQKIYDGFLFDYKEQKTFFHGHTYTGNPLACAAALANLKVFQKEKTLKKMQGKIKFLERGLGKFQRLIHVGDIRQKGLMTGIELVKDKQKKQLYPWQEKIGVKVCQKARERGVILRPLGNVIVLMPPLSIKKNELKELLSATYCSIKEATENND